MSSKQNSKTFVFGSITIIINMNTIKILLSLITVQCAFLGVSQSKVELPMEDQFDIVTSEWITKSDYLKTYEGINEYCRNPSFRKSVDRLLSEIHNYDRLIISKMENPSDYLSWNTKEERKTIDDVYKLEDDYSMDVFVSHMRESCEFRNEIESNAEELRGGVGAESYDGQVLILETGMVKYLKKIDKLIIKIDDHLHVLHID